MKSDFYQKGDAMEPRLFKYVFVDKNGNKIEESVWAYSEIDADRRAGEMAFRKAYVDYYPIMRKGERK